MSAPANATFTGTASELRAEFLDQLSSRGEGERNVAAHALGLDRFSEYLSPRDLCSAGAGDLEGFLSYLTELGVSAGSLKTYRTVVSRWMDFLERCHGGSAPVAPGEDESPLATADGADSGVAGTARAGAPEAAASLGEVDSPFESVAPPGLRAEPVPDADGNFPTIVLGDFASPAPTPAPGSPSFQPEPTSPMMKALPAEAAPESEPFFEGFQAVRAPTPPGASAVEEPPVTEAAMPALATPEDAQPADRSPSAPPELVSDFEPVTPPSFPAEEMPSDEDFEGVPAPAESEPASPFEAEAEADDAAEPVVEPGELETEPPDSLEGGMDFSFEAPAATLPPPPMSMDPEESAAASESASAFGELPSALADDASLPELSFDDDQRAAEERDRAKLSAPPLPSEPANPAATIPGETAFEGPSESIPLAGLAVADGRRAASGEPTGGAGDRTHRGAQGRTGRSPTLDPTNGAMATQPGTGKWGLRRGREERGELSLDAILTLAVSGELSPTDLVRKPSGEWVSAEELRPLRRALGIDGGPDTLVHRVRTERLLGRAAAGAVVAGLFSGLLWWVSALVVGAELVPLAILGGLLGGFGARAAGRAAGPKIGLLGAGAAPLSVLVGRYLVYETLSSGIALEGFQEIGGLGSFLGSGLGTTQVACLGLGALAGLLVGSVGGR